MDKSQQMFSELLPDEFYEKLRSKVQVGNPWMKSSPFGIFHLLKDRSKPYYGKCSPQSFALTSNFSFFGLTDFVAEGDFKNSIDAKKTLVSYKLSPTFLYWWLRIPLPVIIVIMSIYQFVSFGYSEFSEIITLWLFFGIPWFFTLWLIKRRKSRFDQNFKKTFQINA